MSETRSEVTGPQVVGAQPPDIEAKLVGRYVYLRENDEWHWNDAIFQMHGFEPNMVVPTTDVLLAHLPAEDRAEFEQMLTRCSTTGRAFSSYHRIEAADGTQRNVLVVGHGMRDPEGKVLGSQGYFVDLTTRLAEEKSVETREAVARASKSRAVIEQAKGALMMTYGLDDHSAYVVLAWRSQQDNIKLREFAQIIVDAIQEGEQVGKDARTQMDTLLAEIPSGHADDDPASMSRERHLDSGQ